jgi:hypothetical protein
MAVLDLYSKRQKRLRGEVPDVYQYVMIPNPLRVQIIHIIQGAFGRDGRGSRLVSNEYHFIHQSLCREYGVFTLKEYFRTDAEALFDYFLNCKNYEQVIDIIEMFFRSIDSIVRKGDYQFHANEITSSPDEAIEELNARFKEHGVGYQFESGAIMRIDSEFLHSESVKPVLSLLRNGKRFQGANEEFLKAHEHYRHGRHKEALVDALKAFESVMKIICDKQKWVYNKTDTAKKLIDVCLKNNLIPNYLQTQFSSLRSLLESGIPTVRNKLGGHGQGKTTTQVNESIVRYALHLTATNIDFLTRLEKENFS